MRPFGEVTFARKRAHTPPVFTSMRRRRRLPAGLVHGALLVLCAGGLFAEQAVANGESLYLECPCEVSSDGTTLTITAGIRSFKSRDSAPLFFGVSTIWQRGNSDFEIARVDVTESLAAGATLEATTRTVEFKIDRWRIDDLEIELVLYEGSGDQAQRHDRVRMEGRVDIGGSYRVNELDLLEDTDGDGVGDFNERLEGTDPLDSASRPGDSTIDVLALYSQDVPNLYNGDPTTRIQHTFALANRMLANSSVQLSLRLVGVVETRIDESARFSHPALELRLSEAERHGADLIVLYRRPAVGLGACGSALIGGDGTRGLFILRRMSNFYATIDANCGAATLAHEIGHLMGLGHAVWQTGNSPTGTWRWSRGHAVDHDFGTLMTYGPQDGPGTRLDVFSNPDAQCTGLQEKARPCGVDPEEVNGADAVTTLNVVRFQVARFRDSLPDADGDGHVDPVDDLPADAGEWLDTDGDGIGNNADADDDGDGVNDPLDVFPLDAAESADTDSDGVGDNADAFPEDPLEVSDRDGDLVGDNADRFPDDPTETVDTDGDGVGDNADLWPDDSRESADTDGDGIGDNADPDADNDGVVGYLDLFPLDATKWNISSYIFTGENPGDLAGEVLAGGGGGDQQSFLVGVPYHDVDANANAGAVYMVSAQDLAMLDSLDGQQDRSIDLGQVVSGAHSWKFVGAAAGDLAGRSVFSGGDLDGDGMSDVLVGASAENSRGAVYLVSGADFAAADAADGTADRTIQLDLAPAQPDSWKFLGEADYDDAGRSVAAMPDSNGDGKSELLIGAPGHRPSTPGGSGATYLVSSTDLLAADTADGMADGVIALGNIAGAGTSWKLVDQAQASGLGYVVAAADVDGDGHTEAIVSAPYVPRVTQDRVTGAVYVVATADLSAADERDGAADRVVDMGALTAQPGSWKLVNGRPGGWAQMPVALLGRTEGYHGWLSTGPFVVSAADLAPADAADGSVDGTVQLQNVILQPDSWRVHAQLIRQVGDADGDGGDDLLAGDYLGWRVLAHMASPATFKAIDEESGRPDGVVWRSQLANAPDAWTMTVPRSFGTFRTASAGDINGDGISDHLIGNQQGTEADRGEFRLLFSADLEGLDRADRTADTRMLLTNLAGDADSDGTGNTFDPDDDNDGFADHLDRFALDPTEWADTDQDGVGDNADDLPYNVGETVDTDGDGLGDRFEDNDDDGDGIPDVEDAHPYDTDNDGMDNRHDPDDDNDGVPDVDDGLPLVAGESVDTDGDGIGNNADTDDDNDGVPDTEDALPLDDRDSVDTDGDGVGDTIDAFPNDAAETADFDGDGVGDNADTDDDNDGVADVDDQYPFDAGASVDTDGDGVPDSRDRYPTHPGEWENTDGAGFGDNRDTDDDNDGVPDVDDAFPKDRSRSNLTSYRIELSDVPIDFPSNSVSTAGDLDGDGSPELLIRPVTPRGAGARDEVFIVSPQDLADLDAADGTRNGAALFRHIAAQAGTWRLVGSPGYTTGESIWSLGDLGEDGIAEFFVSAAARYSLGHVVSGADLLAADAADGMADRTIEVGRVAAQPASWRFRGYWTGGVPTVSRAGDLGGDGQRVLAIGHPGARAGDSPGSVLVVQSGALAAIDSLDGNTDGSLAPFPNQASYAVWHLLGEEPEDFAGSSVQLADFDGDGQAELVIGAPGHDTAQADEGALYLINGEDLASADSADGTVDRTVDLGHVAAQANSWKLVGELAGSRLGAHLVTGDVDGEGAQDLMLMTRKNITERTGSVLTWNHDRLTSLDAADGTADGEISLASFAGRSWRASGTFTSPPIPRYQQAAMTDFDGDGMEDLLIGMDGAVGESSYRTGIVALFISSASLFGETAGAATAMESFDGIIERGGSYSIFAPEIYATDTTAVIRVASAGDVDADGLGDILLTLTPTSSRGAPYRAAYLINGADLPFLDRADGRMDGRIVLSNIVRARN